MRKKFKYSFARGEMAEGGVESVLLAVLAILLFVSASLISFFMKGNGGNYLGALGLFSMMSSVWGFYLGLMSFREKNKNHKSSIIGSVANGLIAVGWLGLFLSGV